MRRVINSCKSLIDKQAFGFSEVEKFNYNFLNTTNVAYIESLYEQYLQDKNSVSPSFQAFFNLLQQGQDPEDAFSLPPKQGEKIQLSGKEVAIAQQLKYRLLIDRIRTLGHQFAKTDPLDMPPKQITGKIDFKNLTHPGVDLTEEQSHSLIYNKNLRPEPIEGDFKINQVQQYLRNVYCGPVGYQFMHLTDKNERSFLRIAIQQTLQSLATNQPSKKQRLDTFERLCKDQTFIDFLGNKFGNYKRFGIQGLNSGISAMGCLFEQAVTKYGAEYLVLGMAHRGRLNTLHCIFDKPAQVIFQQFLEKKQSNSISFSAGDVKYHLGYVTKKKFGEKQAVLSILPNPSHLEAVNPLVYGRTRALQEKLNDEKRQKVIGVVVHGDAAISGQGIVYQTAQMHDLKDMSTGGIIHIVLNNQVGFTTNPNQSRSSYYCTQIAKVVGAPVLHINADQPDVLDKCMRIAMAYRNKFKKDIYIDIIGYRRFGHNEQDQPTFTQPKMYEKIRQRPSMFEIYSKKLIEKGILTQEEVKAKINQYQKEHEEDYIKVIENRADKTVSNIQISEIKPHKLWGNGTGVPKKQLSEIFHKITQWPEQFNIHPTIKKLYQERIKNFQHNHPLDWATMESLAFGTLLHEGYGVRLSGQDVQRGTFSHRHAIISDQKRDVSKYMFLKKINHNVTINNSFLSQYGVMGFQYGYSITDPNSLVIWEAQFGDFANGAQIMIDNFVVSSETKWNQQSGLVLNLPHGMDGQGPEHSQARIERFLQLSDDNCDVQQNLSYEQQMKQGNIQVVCCSTSANYFHVLRRQIRRSYRKPLVLFNSKKLLKFKPANRTIQDILEGKEFSPVYGEENVVEASQIKKVIFCSGQFYYEMKQMRDSLKRNDVAIVRIEQIAPFPYEHIKKIISDYKNVEQFVWAQQEHENYGPWNFIRPRLQRLLGKKIQYHGRGSSSSTAVGFLKIHKRQQKKLLHRIFELEDV